MKTKVFISFAVSCAAVLIISCSKSGSSGSVSSTLLQITVTNGFGFPVSGAAVSLYLSKNDLDSQINRVGNPLTTDAGGTVTFHDLSAINYFWYIEKGCQNNYNGIISSANALKENALNIASILVSETGEMKFVNTSAQPYRIFLNGSLIIDSLPGLSLKSIMKVPTGFYIIRVLEITSDPSPTDKIYTGNLNCGDTFVTTFP